MDALYESKADLHVHSKYSDRPSEWFLRRIGAPECFVEPLTVYARARDRGMAFVTITDHNCIRGALEIAHLPGTFISSEITTYFPEDGCKIHVLVYGIDEAQFRTIQELRANIYELHRYLAEEEILCSVAHPLYRINNRLTIDHVEKLILMFKRFEAINGARHPRAAEIVDAVFRSLTPAVLDEMANRQDMAPTGPEPWEKHFTAGSDDHSGVYTAWAHTVAPYAADATEFLAQLRRGEHWPAGGSGSSVMMGHSLYHIAYGYYKARFVKGNGKPTLMGQVFEKLLERAEAERRPAGFGQWLRDTAAGFVWARKKARLSEVERLLVDEFAVLFSSEPQRDTASPPLDHRRTFEIACQICHTLGYSFLRRFEKYAREGRLMESLQTVASLGPVALSIAPYLASFSAQHNDDKFLSDLASHFPAARHLQQKGRRRAWVTDTFSDVNGVARTIRAVAGEAHKHGMPVTVITCLEEAPQTRMDVKNFAPIGTFGIPEYESQRLSFPPFLEVIEYLEKQRFSEVVISTPGPLGLAALAGARLLNLRTTGIYHTDFPQYVRRLTQDDALEDVTWKAMQWFYEQMDRILAPSEYYRKHLAHHGFDPTKLGVLMRGVDTTEFHPSKREPQFYQRRGLGEGPVFVYVGRVSGEKNLPQLAEAFRELLARGRKANLAIVGDGPDLAALREQCRDLPVAFTGFLDGEELAAAYASADCMVFPSTSDTFGNAVLEAQASGLPAIVGDRGGPPDIVRTHDSGLVVDVHRPGALADAMERFCAEPEWRDSLGRRALRNAAERTWELVLKQLWNGPEASQPPVGVTPTRTKRPEDAAVTASLICESEKLVPASSA